MYKTTSAITFEFIYLIWLLPIVLPELNTIKTYASFSHCVSVILSSSLSFSLFFLFCLALSPFILSVCVRANFMSKFYCDVILHNKRKRTNIYIFNIFLPTHLIYTKTCTLCTSARINTNIEHINRRKITLPKPKAPKTIGIYNWDAFVAWNVFTDVEKLKLTNGKCPSVFFGVDSSHRKKGKEKEAKESTK